ncbi:ABC transporter ATP-binding protein [Halobacillus yeomjeoni]|uniref:ABC transporter ATP-binding protein n=1 Tax=Halobacillus yeomjeoni TaxID=311194 RepID=A0A931HYG3_9BACI|nr:ABC transporter ATP-binding protein [Halobacillus yeomjeoni]MBH0231685.1 ABC transporter ATP-binding protein [Halobacillus yeomjeoni]
MIQVQQLHKEFEKTKVLNDVHFHVRKGSIYGLLGSNGAGKTTLLRTVAGILKQSRGEVSVLEDNVFENESIKQRMVFLPDTLYFLPHYTVRQMADFYKEIYENWNEERFQKLNELFELDVNKKIQQFSKGMQRQVAFWLSMSVMPDVLVLDEPFDGLDAVMRKKIRNLIVQDVADREMTVLISSHNLREVEDLCDFIGILHKGEILLERDLDDLKADIHKIQVAFKDDMNAALESELNVLHKEQRGSIQLLIVRGEEEQVTSLIQSHQPLVFDRLPLTLEEIFIYEMGGVGYAIENILV